MVPIARVLYRVAERSAKQRKNERTERNEKRKEITGIERSTKQRKNGRIERNEKRGNVIYKFRYLYKFSIYIN